MSKLFINLIDEPIFDLELPFFKFSENQKNQIEEEKNLVNEEWRKYVENILKENKIYKDQLIIYFKSISGLMSSELRKLIINKTMPYDESPPVYGSFIFAF